MRCWIIATYEPLPTIDAGTRLLRCGLLARHLVDAGHEVAWFTSSFNHPQRRNRVDRTTTRVIEPGYTITMLHAPPYRRSISFERVRHNRAVAAEFRRVAVSCTRPPDLIFACIPSLELAEQAVTFGRERGIPVVVDVRDPWPDVYLTAFPPMLRSAARLALRAEYSRVHRILSLASGVTAVSHDYLQWGLAHARRSASPADGVYPIGYPVANTAKAADQENDVARLGQLAIAPDEMVVSFVGMFGASYDLETVVAAARLLDARPGHRVRLVIAGDGDNGASLRRRAGNSRVISFPGWLSGSEVETLLRASAVGLAAYSRRARQSLPNKPFEYMAAGLPIVSSLPGELERLLRDHRIGRQYRAHDPASLVGELLWLWHHPEERATMGRCARALLESEYGSDRIYAGLMAHLCALGESNGTRAAAKASVVGAWGRAEWSGQHDRSEMG